MAHYYKFYQVEEDRTETVSVFYVQCEWYNKTLDLDVDGDPNEEYCHLTITDLTAYWQITINRELLLERFKPSSALNPLLRNHVLTLALQGYQRILKQKVSWTIVRENHDQLKLKLKTYYDINLPGIAGYMFINKTPDDQKNELQKLWFKNSAIASQTATETEGALNERINDVEEKCKNLQDSVDTMKRETIEYKFSVFSNFSKVLNAKKNKIRDLKDTVEDLKKRLREEDIKEEESTDNSQRPKKMQKAGSTSKSNGSSSQPLVSIKNEDEDNPPVEPVTTAASAPVGNDDSSDDDNFSDEDLLLSIPDTM